MIFSQTPSFQKKNNSNLFLREAYFYRDWCFQAPLQADELVETTELQNYTSIFYWVQKFNFRCADFYSDHVKTNAFLLLFLIYLFCFKTGKIYYWASETNLISHLEKESTTKEYIAILKMVNIIQQKYKLMMVMFPC